MITFRHAGDLGDIVYSLPVIRYAGGGTLLIEAAHYTRQLLVPENWCGIDDLLMRQPYIKSVEPWGNGVRATYNLNDFRVRLHKAFRPGLPANDAAKMKSLADWMLETHGVPLTEKDTAWLSVEPVKIARVVINRTGSGRNHHNVYHNHLFPWRRVWDKYHKDAVFIGTELEHDVFCATVGEIPHCVTGTLHDAATVIAGADLFIGNQSVCHAIAEGLKKRIVLEVWPQGPNCLFFRPDVIHGWDQNVELPEL